MSARRQQEKNLYQNKYRISRRHDSRTKDEEKNASVDTPVGDFFGIGHGCTNSYECFPFHMSAHGQGHGGKTAMNCFFSIPFQKRAKLEIVNECEIPVRSFFYYIDYQEHAKLEDLLYFHANCRSDDYSSVAYWYQTEPHRDFSPMPPVEKRLPNPD